MMDRTSYGIFIFVLIFSPLAFGAVEQWSLTVMEGLSVLACLLFLLGNRGKATFHEIPGIVPLTLFLAYMLIQIVPLPAGTIKALSPETYTLLKETAAEGGGLRGGGVEWVVCRRGVA